MRIFLYEYITGGGCWSSGTPPRGSLLAEGWAMIGAVAADFAPLPGVETHVLWDARLPEALWAGEGERLANVRRHVIADADAERQAFVAQATAADGTLVIAPETGGALLERCRWAERVGAKLLSPSAEFVAIATDKTACCERWTQAGVPTPRGRTWQPGECWPPGDVRFPIVRKPVDGCGSEEVYVFDDALSAAAHRPSANCRVEAFCPGQAASIALLCGPREIVPLPAATQQMECSADGRLVYRGGTLPLSSAWQTRAERLAIAALAALPPAVGYVGFDVILGSADDGSEDVVVEVNPRLTTSYVGLRQLARQVASTHNVPLATVDSHGNLAAAMLKIVRGELIGLTFGTQRVEFVVEEASQSATE